MFTIKHVVKADTSLNVAPVQDSYPMHVNMAATLYKFPRSQLQ